MKLLNKFFITLCILCIGISCFAVDGVDENTFDIASEKFNNCNIISAYEDFEKIIKSIDNNDFAYVMIARDMVDLGFFNLASLAISKVHDQQIFKNYIDEMQVFYFPSKRLTKENEMILSETLSNILYNNQSYEATKELFKKKELIINSDYANYLMSLGYFKSNYFTQALQYIDIAILQNPTNINYQILKAKIIAEGKSPQNALKIVASMRKQKFNSAEFENEIDTLEQYLLSKTDVKNKEYYLANYYYLQKEYAKAIKVLQLSPLKEKEKTDIYALFARIYFDMNEIEKSKAMLKKVHKKDKVLVVSGDLKFKNKDYKQALKYYKKALKADKNSSKVLLKLAKTYQMMNNTKKAQITYSKILKTSSTCAEAYFQVGLMNNDEDYIKKSLAVDMYFEPAWQELAQIEFKKGNSDLAKKYLLNTIDENEFRYYYRQRLGQ